MTDPTTPTHRPPPDRSHLLTEQRNAGTAGLHTMSVDQIVGVIQREDRAVLDAMDRAAPALTALITDAEPRFARGGRLIYFGAGTSGRLGVLDASEAPPTFQVEPGRVIGIIAGGDSALRKSSEGMEDDPSGAAPAIDALRLTPDDTLVGIAAGGTTPYVLGGLAHAARSQPDGLRGMITCTPIDRPDGVDHLVVLETGPEVLTGSTRMKAGTATKLALNMISTTAMLQLGKAWGNLMVDLNATNAKLLDRSIRIVSSQARISREEAAEVLTKAEGRVKPALIMAIQGCDLEEALMQLERSDQKLRPILGPPR